MKPELERALDRSIIDVQAVNSLIITGHKTGLFTKKFETLHLFSNYAGKNIFQHLASHEVLSMILPTFFGPSSKAILAREGFTDEFLKTFAQTTFQDMLLKSLDKGCSEDLIKSFNILDKKVVTDDSFKTFAQTTFQDMLLQSFDKQCSKDIIKSFNIFAETPLYKHSPGFWIDITSKVQKTNTEISKNAFTALFQENWRDILLDHNMSDSKIMLLVSEIVSIISHKGGNATQGISLKGWGDLLRTKTFTDIEAVKQYIFHKCAERFLAETPNSKETLSTMVAEDLVDLRIIEKNLEANLKANSGYIRLSDFASLCSRSTQTAWSDLENAALTKIAVPLDITPVREDVLVATEVAVAQTPEEASSVSVENSAVLAEAAEAFIPVPSGEDATTDIPPAREDVLVATEVAIEQTQEEASSVSEENSVVLPEAVQALIPPPSVKAYAKPSTKDVIKYASFIMKAIMQKAEYTEPLVKYFGTSDVDTLHVFIYMLDTNKSFFGPILIRLSEIVKKNPITQEDFLKVYVDTLEESHFLTLCPKYKLNSYDLACMIDQVDVARLLLNKGFNLKVYGEGNHSLFDSAFKNKCTESTKVIKYLLTEQKLIPVDWYHVLSLAMKYTNIDAIDYYVSSECEVQDIRDHDGNPEEGSKYSILNKGILYLQSLVEPLLNNNLEQKHKDDITTKIPLLCKCIEIMINSNKVYYAEDNKLVCAKTLSLLKSLKNVSDRILEGSYKSALNDIRDLIIKQYEDFDLWPGAQEAINKLRNNIIDHDDTKSEASGITNQTHLTHYSILSNLCDDKENIFLPDKILGFSSKAQDGLLGDHSVPD